MKEEAGWKLGAVNRIAITVKSRGAASAIAWQQLLGSGCLVMWFTEDELAATLRYPNSSMRRPKLAV